MAGLGGVGGVGGGAGGLGGVGTCMVPFPEVWLTHASSCTACCCMHACKRGVRCEIERASPLFGWS